MGTVRLVLDLVALGAEAAVHFLLLEVGPRGIGMMGDDVLLAVSFPA